MRFRNVIVFLLDLSLVGACCTAFVILIGEIKHASELKLAAAQKTDQITDIWINRMQGSFFVFLPDNTARIYESYSFDLINVGKWQRVEDRPVYPESPSIVLARGSGYIQHLDLVVLKEKPSGCPQTYHFWREDAGAVCRPSGQTPSSVAIRRPSNLPWVIKAAWAILSSAPLRLTFLASF